MAGARTQSAPPDTRADTDDALLAIRAAEGDEDAFAVLVQRHAPALIRLATSLLGAAAEAEDAVQDAFLSAWRRLPEFQGRAAFGTWMYRIVTNRCLNVLRARRPVAPLEAADEVPAAEHTVSPARITEGRDAVRELREALDLLSAEQRACWVLRELDGRSYEFVAEAVGISQEAVRARVFRARRCLTQALGAWR
ncbi:RNA polymerase sigma-70 factor (ECF subfamily) [Streptomyces sp. SAI-208]|uniref:RNA polymerase sigma factor n=1 Tax=unclassified Streptomyces TaxID=2593676 RepID=UPI0024753233|nr:MULTISPECIES: sigma-70 family RNA polymerase sigma factor [unclassified Streptomyces]MDH6517745.1 RNA polymerase sigma-70 factor (ECF subfamily) [Streptomyces sp. SAI-090]MDH6549969.1 RNA polymerase sigma-70 factor (ECF subfamily) [Streptomyces sp. SAI-041]MDH6569020.1 RNA polymerase sigma-70 factor (ECF subfamily) [Streptomyces sp. SAI-117]MDH6586027.1 RNA polymerase sigma-70 factor (ECF subfamily) [Streptomyces sp. SAI-133]MDH6608603.1 RNA polymerase sigma-70 factor (ECF subfamily) [Strep